MRLSVLLISAFICVLGGCAPPPSPTPVAKEGAQQPTALPADGGDWQKRWEELIAAARREGKVVVKGPPTAEVRTGLPRAFRERFGVEMEYIGGPTGPFAAQLRSERQAGGYSTDVVLSGADTLYTVLYPEKMLDPIPPVLVHPDAKDGSKWPEGKLWFMDPEGQYILRLNNYLSPILEANTAQVKVEEIRSWYDLLKPEYQGRIASYDPTTTGSGVGTAAYLYKALGENYVKRLYIDQRPTFTRDYRQLADWLARGSYPIVMSLTEAEFDRVKREGFPVATVPHPPEAPGYISAGFGLLALLNNAPHPNAAKLFVNWIASKEGMEVWSRAQGNVPSRLDIDRSSFPEYSVPGRPLGSYVDSYGWDFVLRERQEIMAKLRALVSER